MLCCEAGELLNLCPGLMYLKCVIIIVTCYYVAHPRYFKSLLYASEMKSFKEYNKGKHVYKYDRLCLKQYS